MSYFPRIKIEYADSPAVDAFSRLRTSQPTTLFDSKQTTDNRPLYWADKFSLNASSSYTNNRASTILTASSTVGSTAIRQSKMRAAYQPGKSLFCITTHVFGASVSGIRKRVGLFDDRNGVFLEDNGGSINIVMRSSVTGTPVDQTVSQSAWNVDKLDGSGASGTSLNLAKSQLTVIDLQWLGVGRVRVGFEVSGSITYCQNFDGANLSSSVYMSSPNLPVRYEISNIGAAVSGTLEQICSTIQSEAGYEPHNFIFSADRGVSALTGVTNAALYPVLSIRPKSSQTGSFIIPVHGSIFCTSNAANGFRWAVVLNPRVGPIDNASWTNVLSSSVEYDISRNSQNALTGGILLASGYGVTPSDLSTVSVLESMRSLGADIDGNTDQVVLVAQVIGGTTESFVGSLSWKEFC